jgi:hypothetical protein
MCYGEKAVTGRRLDGLCKKNSFDSIHDAADQFRELNERWNNRFTLQGQSLVEKYREGRMSVVCDFEFSRTAKWSRGAISCNGDIADNPVVSLVFCAKTEDRSYLYDWKQKPVFVEDVDIMQGPQGVIPSSVRFYDIHDEVKDVFGGLLYQSAIDASYKFIPRFKEWKYSVIVVPSKSSKVDFVNSKVQSALEVVRGISNDKSNVSWQGFSYIELDAIVSGLKILIGAKRVKITSSKSQDFRVKIIDVLLGPFNL